MVHYSKANLDNIFFALSDSVRREILTLLLRSEINIKNISTHFQITLQGVIKHIKILERANLVQKEKIGRENICRINTIPLTDATEFINYYTQFWQHNIDNLSDYLISMEKKMEGDKTNG
ncbi:MAG: winged helix-turn-helix domain-containing protein [Leptospirales bacterium]